MTTAFSYHTFGLDIEAGFACPELAPATGPAYGRPVRITLGAVPDDLVDPVCSRPLSWIDRSGTLLHRIPGIARFMVRRGAVVVALEPGAAPDRMPGFLRDLPLLMQACQWGLAPLNAASLALKDGAFLLAGPPAVGRSCLALALTAQGCRLMADSACVLDASNPVRPLVLPAAPGLSLWPDSLPRLGLGCPATIGPDGRARLSCPDLYEARPLPIRAVVWLHPDVSGAEPQWQQGPRAFETVVKISRAAELTRTLLGEKARLAAMAALAGVPVVVVPYGRSLGEPSTQAAALLHLLAPQFK